MALESQWKGRRSQEDATRPSDGSTGTLELSRKDSGSVLRAGGRPDGGPGPEYGRPGPETANQVSSCKESESPELERQDDLSTPDEKAT
jgi:hypothetical protein